ncbi:hypothetical protein F924_00011, partial [Acinetobacter lwoffii ATCC 9957 = CIP 70.31]
QIRAVQLTTNNVSDSQVLGDLLDQIPQDEQINSILILIVLLIIIATSNNPSFCL